MWLLPILIKFYWNMATHKLSRAVHDCDSRMEFFCNRDGKACKPKTWTTWPFTEKAANPCAKWKKWDGEVYIGHNPFTWHSVIAKVWGQKTDLWLSGFGNGMGGGGLTTESMLLRMIEMFYEFPVCTCGEAAAPVRRRRHLRPLRRRRAALNSRGLGHLLSSLP